MSKKKIQACELCSKKYSGVFVTEHVCKRCFRSVCKDCADKKGYFFIATQNKKSQHRMCNACWADIDKIQAIVKQCNIRYNQLSTLAKNWINFAEQQQKQYVKGTKQDKIQVKIRQNIKKLNLSTYWPQLNYSFRTFLGTCSIKSKEYLEYLKILNDALLQINYSLLAEKQIKPQQIIQLIQNQICLSLFILCHSDIKNFRCLHSYYTRTLKQCSIQRCTQTLKMILKQNLKQTNGQRLKVIQKNAIKYMKSTFYLFLKKHTNWLHIQIVNWLINEIFLSTNGAQFFQIFFCYILYTLKDFLGDNNDDYVRSQMFKIIILKQIQLPIKYYKAKTSKKQSALKVQPVLKIQQLQTQQKTSSRVKIQINQQIKQNTTSTSTTTTTTTTTLNTANNKLEQINSKIQKQVDQKMSQKHFNSQNQNQNKNQNKNKNKNKQVQQEKQISQKLSAAKLLLDKIEAGQEISEQYLLSLNIDNIDQYLDQIIKRNDQDLQNLEEMDEMIDQVHFKIQNLEL